MFHILVVDDDKNTRRLMRAMLESDGYTVSTAENGQKALNPIWDRGKLQSTRKLRQS